MTDKDKAKGAVDPAAFAETERDPVALDAVERAMRQVMAHPAKPQDGSENREPTREEIARRFKLVRRD